MWKKRLAGEITPHQHRKFWLAAVTFEKFEYADREAFFIDHLQKACEGMAHQSGDFLEDLSDWWNRIVSWLMENWDTVLKVLLSLLVFLETPENVEETTR